MQGVVGDHRGRPVLPAAVAADSGHHLRREASQRPPHCGSRGDHDRERDGEHRQRQERRDRQSHQRGVSQRPLADSDHGLGDDRQHSRGKPGEQRRDRSGRAKPDVDRGQRQQCNHTGQHEQDSGALAQGHTRRMFLGR